MYPWMIMSVPGLTVCCESKYRAVTAYIERFRAVFEQPVDSYHQYTDICRSCAANRRFRSVWLTLYSVSLAAG
jgi:hypothetical protein